MSPRRRKRSAKRAPVSAQEVRKAVNGVRKLQQRIRRRSAPALTDREVRECIEKGRSVTDRQLAMLREPGAAAKLRRAFASTPEQLAKAANAARRGKR